MTGNRLESKVALVTGGATGIMPDALDYIRENDKED